MFIFLILLFCIRKFSVKFHSLLFLTSQMLSIKYKSSSSKKPNKQRNENSKIFQPKTIKWMTKKENNKRRSFEWRKKRKRIEMKWAKAISSENKTNILNWKSYAFIVLLSPKRIIGGKKTGNINNINRHEKPARNTQRLAYNSKNVK